MQQRGIRRYWQPAALLVWALFWIALPASATGLSSQFLNGDTNAAAIMSGSTYDMNDPQWLNNYRINRGVFAYKVYSALIMLGYQAENFQWGPEAVTVFKIFQAKTNCSAQPISSLLRADCLAVIDQQLVQREAFLAEIGPGFPLYGHMQALVANDVSKDALAAMYWLPMSVLPASLQMNYYETLQCLAGQCNGFIHDASGATISSWPVRIDPLANNYYFVGAYFDPFVTNFQMVGAAVSADTVLHEFGHYIDGFIPWSKDPLLPHLGGVDTRDFYNINYDIKDPGNQNPSCVKRRSQDVKDWLSLYGFSPYKVCPDGYDNAVENWAESFQMYVTAGRDFRAAALQSTYIAQEYEWLKTQLFNGVEFDTDLAQGYNSGCNDVPGAASRQPAYMHCDGSYVWDFTLPHDTVHGACGSAAGGSFVTAPSSGLCDAGAMSLATQAGGSWTWSCRGLNSGVTAPCSATVLTGYTPDAPTNVAAAPGSTSALVSFSAPANSGGAPISGYTVVSYPAGGVDSNAGSTALTHTVTGLTNDISYTFIVIAHNMFGDSAASVPSLAVTPSWSLVVESFDAVASGSLPSGWQSIHQTQNSGAWTVNTGGNYPAGVLAHSGNNLVYFNSHTAMAGATEDLISPPFSLLGVSGAKVSFWMYRDGDASVFMTGDTVVVYVNTSASRSGATSLLTVPRSRWQTPSVATAGWYHYTADIPAGYQGATNYLLFSGSSQHGNDTYIDDIVVATPPGAPIVTDVVGGNAQATVTISPPLNNGGSAVTGYTVTSSPAGGIDSNAGSSSLTHTVTGLVNGTSYTFTATASNAVGSATSTVSIAVIPVTVPAAPTAVVATAGNKLARVTFLTPTSDGGSPIIGYQVTASPAHGVDTSAGTVALSHTIIGLTNGTSYTFSVTASSAFGSSALSVASVPVTPAPNPTTVVLDASPNPSVYGQLVTFTATVGGSALIGTVDLIDNSPPGPTPLWPPHGLTGAQAQVFVDSLSAGSHPIVAAYSHDDNNADSVSAQLNQIVNRANVQVAVTGHTPDPVYVGHPVWVSATVDAAAPATGYPTGNIAIGDGASSCQYSLAASSGCYWTPNQAGSQNLAATYAGDANFNGSSSPAVGHTVNAIAAPGAPTIAAITPGNGSLTVSVVVPADDGGAPINGYSVSCTRTAGGAPPVTAAATTTAVPVPGLTNGVSYSCVATASNNVGGAGAPSSAILGTPGLPNALVAIVAHTPDPSLVGSSVAVSVSVRPAKPAASIGRGGNHTCLITDQQGELLCWGANGSGQLGDGSTIDRPVPVPVSVLGLPGAVTAVVGGESHTCALSAGSVWCWGDNSSGQLGADPVATARSSVPLHIAGLTGVIAITAGSSFNCALLGNGTVRCWGEGASGALGDGQSSSGYPTPTPIPVAVNFNGVSHSGVIAAIGAGVGHACAIDGAGKVFCWGTDNIGQLGDNGTGLHTAPVAVLMPPQFAKAVSVSGGLEHTCALSDVGAVWCWGGNSGDELGNPTASGGSGVPVATVGLSSGVVSLSAGLQDSCAVDVNGMVYCWGTGIFEAVGGGNANPSTPVVVSPAGSKFVAVATGYNHHCALDVSGGLVCWGGNDFGQLGDAGTTARAALSSVIGYATPTGSVTVGDTVASCQIALPATSCAWTPATAGSKTLSAAYSGDGSYLSGMSATVGHTVNTAAPGACGAANGLLSSTVPSTLCAAGSTPSSVTTSASGYTWSCASSNGGAPASCAAPRGYTLSASGGGNGTVSPPSQLVAYNAQGTVQVTPNGGYHTIVSSNCGGTLMGTTFTSDALNADCAMSASFSNAAIGASYQVVVEKTGTGQGQVLSDVLGIDCGASCSGNYPVGTSVTLTASAGSGSQFAGWMAACAGSGSCTLNVDGDKKVVAIFNSTTPAGPFDTPIARMGFGWVSGGGVPWGWDPNGYQQPAGPVVVRSGLIGDGQSNWVKLKPVQGPMTVSFYWKVSSEAGHDELSYWVDGVQLNVISGEQAWAQISTNLGAGAHEVGWVYRKDGTGKAGADAGWVDVISPLP